MKVLLSYLPLSYWHLIMWLFSRLPPDFYPWEYCKLFLCWTLYVIMWGGSHDQCSLSIVQTSHYVCIEGFMLWRVYYVTSCLLSVCAYLAYLIFSLVCFRWLPSFFSVFYRWPVWEAFFSCYLWVIWSGTGLRLKAGVASRPYWTVTRALMCSVLTCEFLISNFLLVASVCSVVGVCVCVCEFFSSLKPIIYSRY